MNIREIKHELENARRDRKYRVAFCSIIRRHCEEIKLIDSDKKEQFVKNIGASQTYITLLSQELSVVEYNRYRTNK